MMIIASGWRGMMNINEAMEFISAQNTSMKILAPNESIVLRKANSLILSEIGKLRNEVADLKMKLKIQEMPGGNLNVES